MLLLLLLLLRNDWTARGESQFPASSYFPCLGEFVPSWDDLNKGLEQTSGRNTAVYWQRANAWQ